MTKEDLIEVEGVSDAKADALIEAGFESVQDLRRASQDDLTEAEGIGKALSARIKADVGGLEVDEDYVPSAEEEEEVSEALREEELVDRSPELSDEEWSKLRRRNSAGKPGFKRQDHHKKKRVPTSWRRPLGSHSKHRKQKTSRGAVASVGHRGDSDIRGLHPSGFREVMVHRPEEVDGVDPEREAIRISGSVGGRKRERIQEAAVRNEVKVLNPVVADVDDEEEVDE